MQQRQPQISATCFNPLLGWDDRTSHYRAKNGRQWPYLGVQRPSTSCGRITQALLPRPGPCSTQPTEDTCTTGIPVEKWDESNNCRCNKALLALVLRRLRFCPMGQYDNQRSRMSLAVPRFLPPALSSP